MPSNDTSGSAIERFGIYELEHWGTVWVTGIERNIVAVDEDGQTLEEGLMVHFELHRQREDPKRARGVNKIPFADFMEAMKE